MINIDESNFVGKGNHREVYRHPTDPSLCIKINVCKDPSSREIREVKREKDYYRLLKKQGVSWGMLPAYHGDVITNLGEGSVFDLITDANDKVSKTLGFYLTSNELTQENYDGLVSSLSQLKEYLLTQRIIVRGLAHRNMVCQRSESGIYRIAIVDNIGNSEFIPISNYVSYLAKRKINKKWARFKGRLLGEFPDNSVLQRIIETL